MAPPLRLPEHTELLLSAALGRVGYVSRQNFNADSGELNAVLNYRGERNQAQWSAGTLIEHADRGRLGGDRHGWYASMQLQHKFGDRLGAELGLTRQDWRGASAYSPGLIDLVRHQSTRQVRAALVRPVTPNQSVLLELRHVHNKENISLFQYNTDVVQLTWRYSGF